MRYSTEIYEYVTLEFSGAIDLSLLQGFDKRMPEPISFTSTSSSTATGSPIVLRDLTSVRLVFSPLLLNNPHDADAAIKGEFLYQRKSASRAWEDVETIPLSNLRMGEGYKLALSSGETLMLFEALRELYAYVEAQGIPMGTHELVPIPHGEVLQRVKAMLEVNDVGELLRLFLSWAEENDFDGISDVLNSDHGPAIINFDTVIGAARLQLFLNEANSSLEVGEEAFWQEFLKKNAWAISQIYSYPILIAQDKAYVGGKGLDNHGGAIVDFLFSNSLSKNALVVEIKTPTAILMNSSAYRNQVYAPSSELSGATLQTLTSRSTLIADFRNVSSGSNNEVQVFNPHALLIIGRLPTIQNQLRSFEIYRNNLFGIEIVTFDELIAKAKQLLDLLHRR